MRLFATLSTRLKIAAAMLAVICGCVGTANVASAGIVNYSDVSGDNVVFMNLVESSTGTGMMYGQPIALGDTLQAPGTGFLSQSAGGGIELVDGRLQLTIDADNGFEFNQITVAELGSFFGFGPDAFSLINSFATVQIGGDSYSGGMMMSQTGAGQSGWSGNYTISFPATDQVILTLNNQLMTMSGAASAAFADISSVRIIVSPFQVAVPEPTMIVLPMLAAIGLVQIRRRRV